jgi:hypothetical protein
MNISIVTTDSSKAAVRQALASNPRSQVHGTPEYLRFLHRAVGGVPHEVVAVHPDGRVLGASAWFRAEGQSGTIINSLPWHGSHGGCALVAGLDDQLASKVRRALLQNYLTAISAPDVLAATMVLPTSEQSALSDYEEVLNPVARDSRIGQVSPLPPPGPNLAVQLEALYQQKTRNLVRKSLRQGFREYVGDDDWAWRYLHETHVNNMLAIGAKPKPWDHLVAIREIMPPDMRRLSVALDGQTPVAAMLLLLWNQTVEYLVPATTPEHRSRQPLSHLIWHAMNAVVEAGYCMWNWGGTGLGLTSLHHFKAGFGAVDHPYAYLINVSPRGREAIIADLAGLVAEFPYYFVFPLAQVDTLRRVS